MRPIETFCHRTNAEQKELGPEFSQAEIKKRLAAAGARFTTVSNEPYLYELTCDALEAGHAVGWFQGRMEFGPRALGARSILGDVRNPEMQKTLNLKVKYRESFRPFAPSVLQCRLFGIDKLNVLRSDISAVTHVDY